MGTAKSFYQTTRPARQNRFKGDSVLAGRVARAVVLPPRATTWDALSRALNMFEPGVKLVRDQPTFAKGKRGLT